MGANACGGQVSEVSDGPLQTEGAPLIGEARREIHESCYAIAAWEGPCARASISVGSRNASDSVMRMERSVRLCLAASSATS